jgi:hypothetical protein
LTSANARSGQINRGTIRPIDPKSLHFIDASNQVDTFMVDDIKEIYDPLAANQVAATTQKKSFKLQQQQQQQQQQPYGSNDRLIDSSQSDYDNRMRQELSGEDVYTLRFSTTVPMETLDDATPSKQQKQHLQSYMYNGSINRPAFEIVSHADVRPATPIKFEETKELKHYHTVTTTAPRKRKSSMSPKKWNDKEIDCCSNQRRRNRNRRHHTHHHHHHHSPNRRNRMPSFSNDEIHYNEHISVSPGTFESSSWIESKNTTNNNTGSFRKKSKLKYARSHTSPIHLNYGCEKSVKCTGEAVQWQIAGELRTTDWDKLKSLDDTHHTTQTYCYSSYDKAQAYERHHFNHHGSKSSSSKQAKEAAVVAGPIIMPSERYVLTKKFQPTKTPPPLKYEDDADIDEYEYAENYSDIKHSTLGVNNPFGGNATSGLGGFVEGVTLVDDLATPPEFYEEKRRGNGNEHGDEDEEQSKRKNTFKQINTSNLLEENNNYTSSASNKFSFNDLSKLNIDKYFSSRKNKNLLSNIDKNTVNSDIDNNDLSSWQTQHHRDSTSIVSGGGGDANDRRRNSSSNFKQQKRTSVSSNNRQTLLDTTKLFTKKIIRDPDTDEILSVKQIDNNNDNTELDNGLNQSNVSIVDVKYKKNSQQIDENDLPSLLPPLEFQQVFYPSEEATNAKKKNSIAEEEDDLIRNGENNRVILRRDNLRTNSRHSTHSTKKHESEDFLATNEINMNFDDIYESGVVRKSESSELNEQTSPRTPGAFKSVIDEIKSFDSGRLKNTVSKNVMNVYEKNLNLLDNNRRQSASKNPPPPPLQPPPTLSHTPSTVSNSKASTSKNIDRRFSNTASNASETNSAHLY